MCFYNLFYNIVVLKFVFFHLFFFSFLLLIEDFFHAMFPVFRSGYSSNPVASKKSCAPNSSSRGNIVAARV